MVPRGRARASSEGGDAITAPRRVRLFVALPEDLPLWRAFETSKPEYRVMLGEDGWIYRDIVSGMSVVPSIWGAWLMFRAREEREEAMLMQNAPEGEERDTEC